MFSCMRPHMIFTLVGILLSNCMHPHMNFTLVACDRIVRPVHDWYYHPARSVRHDHPNSPFSDVPNRSKIFSSNFIHICSSKKFHRIRFSGQLGRNDSNCFVLQTHIYEIIGSGSAYILLGPTLSYLCGISHSSVFPIFSNFILT